MNTSNSEFKLSADVEALFQLLKLLDEVARACYISSGLLPMPGLFAYRMAESEFLVACTYTPKNEAAPTNFSFFVNFEVDGIVFSDFCF